MIGRRGLRTVNDLGRCAKQLDFVIMQNALQCIVRFLRHFLSRNGDHHALIQVDFYRASEQMVKDNKYEDLLQ